MSRLASIFIDLLFLIGGVVMSPVWLTAMIRTGKIKTDWAGRFGRGSDLPAPTSDGDQSPKRVLFHAVSVGEVNAIRRLVESLESENLDIVIATTTNTGYARACDLYGGQFAVVRYPFDFSWAVSKFLKRVQPDLIALVELEVWPNFTLACRRRHIPIVVVNGRLTARSFRGYSKIRLLLRPIFAMLTHVAAQDEDIAERFRQLGTPAQRVSVIPTMKWDNATAEDSVEGADEIATTLGLDRTKPIVVAGSTGDGEESLIHAAVPQDIQLIVAPRKPERFDEAAQALPGCVRWSLCSENGKEATQTRFLLDTIGQLRAAYSLADITIVGRSFALMGGSDMIEPIALGKATIVGPDTSNFASVMKSLLENEGVVQVAATELPDTIMRLLSSKEARLQLGTCGRTAVLKNQGSVNEHTALLRQILLNQP